MNRSTYSNQKQESENFSSFLLEALDLILKKLVELSDLFKASGQISKDLNKSNIITITDKKVPNRLRSSESSAVPSIKAEIHGMQIRL